MGVHKYELLTTEKKRKWTTSHSKYLTRQNYALYYSREKHLAKTGILFYLTTSIILRFHLFV